MNRQGLKKAKRIIVKVGTSVLASKDLALDKAWIKAFAGQIAELFETRQGSRCCFFGRDRGGHASIRHQKTAAQFT